MPSYFSEEEYSKILSSKPKSAPVGSGSQGSINLDKLGDTVSREEYDKLTPDPPYVAPKPQPAISRMAEGAKGLARGTLELATSIGGAGVEAAGQIGAESIDAARAPQAFPGMTAEQFQQMTEARKAQTPTQNPFEGQTEVAQQVFRPDRPSLQPDPRTTPENAPYIQWGGPGGWVPTPQMGVAQQARLFGEAGSMAPAAVATIGAAAATGGIGPAGAFAGGAMGGAIEGLSEYQQVLESGGKPADALRAAAVMGAGSGALNAIPFVAYSTKFLPKGMRNSVGKAMISFVAEGATETAEGGVSAISRMNKLPKSAEEWAEAYRKVEQGVIDESNVFLVAGLMGGGTSMLSKDDTQPQTPPPAPTATEPNTPRYDPRVTPGRPEDNTDLDELEPAIRDWLLNTSDQTTIKIKGKTYKGRAKVSEAPPQTRDDAIDVTATPVDSLRPGPNAPTPNAYDSFEDDFTPWVPQETPVAAPEATNSPAPIVPAPEQQVAPEAPVEQLSPEYQALLDENPELAALLNAAMQQPTAEQTALEQSILGQDLIDSREAKPPVEVRKPAPPLIEARPVLDVGRPVEEQAPEVAGNARIVGELPSSGLVVANVGVDGNIYVGKPGDLHFMVDEKYSTAVTGGRLTNEGEDVWAEEGFIGPDGKFLSRSEAFELVKNEKGFNPQRADRGGASTTKELDALDYQSISSPEPQTAREKFLSRVSVRAQDRPRPGNRTPEQVPSPEVRATVRDKYPKAETAVEQPAQPAAEWLGWQPMGKGKPAVPFYNIPSPTGGMTSVSAETAAAQGYSVPEPPVEAVEAKVDTISGKMDLDEFDAKGYAPNEVTRSEWVSLQRANRRKLGQPEESGTKYAPYADYEEYHRADVERALAKGEEIDDRVLADYPDLAKPTQPLTATANRAAMPEQREGTNYEKTLGAIGDTLAGNKGVVADVAPTSKEKLAAKVEAVKSPAPTTQEKVQALREKAGEKPAVSQELPDKPYVVYGPITVGGKPKYAVRSKAMHPKGLYESLFDTVEEAKAEAVAERKRDEASDAFDVEQAQKAESEAAISEQRKSDTMGGFLDGMPPMRQELIRKQMERKKSIKGKFVSVREYIDSLFDSGNLKVSTIEENKKKEPSRRAWNQMDNSEQAFVRREIEKAGKKTTYFIGDFNAEGGVDLGKTAYDYAQFRLASEAIAIEGVTDVTETDFGNIQPSPAPAPKRTKAKAPSKWLGGMDVAEDAKKPKRGGDEAGYINLGAIAEIGSKTLEAATKPVVFEQGFGAAKPAVAERRAKLKSFELRGKHIAMDFDNGFRKLYKRINDTGLIGKAKGKLFNRIAVIPDKIVNQLNDYLEESDPDMKAELLMELPPELRQPAVKMRELVDNMTDYMLSLGIVEDEQGIAFADNKGVYLRRTYDIFTDPDFRGRRDPRLKETLRKWLKDENPSYSDNKINGIITDLDGVGLSATSTNNMIARGKALGQMDRRTLGKREDIPQEVMDFWGVSRNGYDRFLDTINSQAHIIANYEYLSNLAENLNGISVATADMIRDIERGTYTGDNADEIMSWPRLNDAETAMAIKKETRKKTVTNKEQAIATALDKLSKLPDSAKKTELLTKLRDDALMLKLGLKRDKAGVMSVDPDNLESAAKYIEDLTAEVSSRRKKKDKESAKLRRDLDKYTRQYNKAEGAAATDENLPNMFGSFGPLAGARIHPDLKKALQDALAIKERSEFVDALRGINSQMKQNVTTRNPASAVRNLTSGFDFSMANGWILYGNSVKRLGEAMAIANVDISRNHDPKFREWYLRAAALGVSADTVVIGDITATASNAKKPKLIRDFIKAYPEIAKAMGGPDAVAQKLYQAGDDVFKIFGWLTETEHLMDIGMSRREAEVEAAQRVRNQFPTYSELPKWAQWFKASPVVGPFVAYKTETYRTAYNTVVQAVTEVKNKNPDKAIRRKIQRMGFRRLAGIGAASISRNSIKIMLLAMLGIDPDDEEAIQMAAPVFYQDHTIGITKANKAKGLYEGYNLSTSDAYNVLKEPMYAAIRGEGVGETVGNAAITIGRDYISPEMGASLIAELLTNIQGKSSTIFKKSDTAGEKWLKSAMRVGLDVGVPGGARGFLKAETPEDMINETVTQFTGLKTIKIDMPNDLLYKARALTAIPREQATDVYKYLRAKDKDGAKAEIAKVNATRKDQFMVVHKAYRAYASAGTRADLLDDALKQAGLSQKSINSVKYGLYEDWEGSKPMKEALGR